MTWWVLGSVSASLIRLKCPHCGEEQLRGKRPARESYSCRKCYRLFTGAQGMGQSSKRSRKKEKTDRDD
jgi:ribosomal protein L37AE/L43A